MTSSSLDIRGLSKTFGGVAALSDVDLTLRAGDVHALVGHNGSGKSTLVKILAGYHQADGGATASLGDEPFDLGDAKAAAGAGVRFVHQDLGLVATASAVENLALGTGYSTGIGWRIRWRAEERRAREAISALGFDLDVKKPVGELSAAARTGVAIARALSDWEADVRLLVLDEPTASLPVEDVDHLFAAVARVKAKGLTVLFVSHHLDEVFEIADRVTVLRDGRTVTTVDVAELDRDRLAGLIIGREGAIARDRNAEDAPPPPDTTAAPVLDVRGLRGGDVADVSFSVAPSEVLGITGLRGSGADELAGLVAGKLPRLGEVRVAGELLKANSPRAARDAGVAFVPGDRLLHGVVTTLDVRENTTLSGLSGHMRGPRLSHASEKREARDWIERLGVVASGPDAPILTLSGGNQQKVLLARALRTDPSVLVLDDPTKGVDVGAKEEIHVLVDRLAEGGGGVLVVSSDPEELLRLCHRVVVLAAGHIAQTFTREHLTIEDIEFAQLGGTPVAAGKA